MPETIYLDDTAHPLARLLGQRLKEKRKALGWSQGHLGDRTGVAAGYISFIENAKCNPTLEMILKLAAALELEPWTLLRPSISSAD